MELIDIRDFFQHINNALVDFLLRAAESGMYMGEQMDYNNWEILQKKKWCINKHPLWSYTLKRTFSINNF